jgi:hypothetical protein
MKAQNVGRVGGYAKLDGKGDSVAHMLGSANGETGLVMGRGQLSNLVLEMVVEQYVVGLSLGVELSEVELREALAPCCCKGAKTSALFGRIAGVVAPVDRLLIGSVSLDDWSEVTLVVDEYRLQFRNGCGRIGVSIGIS